VALAVARDLSEPRVSPAEAAAIDAQDNARGRQPTLEEDVSLECPISLVRSRSRFAKRVIGCFPIY
jgi:hypothetical protein